MRHFFIFILLCCSNQVLALDKSIEKVDFDVSMGIENTPMYNFMFRHPDSTRYYHTFKKLFNENFYNKPNKRTKIPKIMHQMWIGGPLPKFFQDYIKTCKEVNPGWEYKLWTEKDFKNLNYNKDVVNGLKTRPDVTKDYLMHVILEKYGGVFLDVDYACFKPFDQLNHKYDAWFVIEPTGWWKKILATSYSIIAAKPNHKIIKENINDIERYVLDKDYRIRHNDEYIDSEVKKDKIFASVQILEAKNIYSYCQNNSCEDIIVFPPTYFLPKVNFDWMVDNIKKYSLIDKVKMHFGLIPHDMIYYEIKPETIAMNDFNAKAKINPLYYKERHCGS